MARALCLPPGLSLPTMSPEGVIFQCLCHMQLAENSFEWVNTIDISKGINDRLPVVFIEKGQVLHSVEGMIHYMQQSHGLDGFLSPGDFKTCTALVGFAYDRLSVVVSHLWFGMENNYENVVKPALSGNMGFIQRLWLPSRFRGVHEELTKHCRYLSHTTETPEELQEEMVGLFERVCEVLVQCLERKKSMFGNIGRLTSLDAVVFGLLACIVSPPFEENPFLASMQKNFPELLLFHKFILGSFPFELDLATRENLRPVDAPPRKKPSMTTGADASREEKEKKDEYKVQRQRAFWVAGAMGVGYLLFSGIGSALLRAGQALGSSPARHPNVKDEEDEDAEEAEEDEEEEEEVENSFSMTEDE